MKNDHTGLGKQAGREDEKEEKRLSHGE